MAKEAVKPDFFRYSPTTTTKKRLLCYAHQHATEFILHKS
jgi:hypothetical protein